MSGAKAECWAGWCCVYLETGDLAVWMHTKESAEECRRFEEVTNGPCGELYPVTVVPTPRWEAMVAKAAAFDAMVHVDREGTPMFDLTKGGEGFAQPNYRHMPKRTRALAAFALARVEAQEESDG